MRTGRSVVGVVLLAVGCGGASSPAVPSVSPVVPSPVAVAPAPVARLGLSVDGGALVALRGISAVMFDASGSSGTGLRYGLDFGDGQGSDRPTASHVYQTGGKIYKARAVVTDSMGRIDSASTDIEVTSIDGTWYSFIFNPSTKRGESRVLNILTQTGKQLTGVYTHPESNTTNFTGEVTDDRSLNVVLSDQTITFRSQGPNGISSDANHITVMVKGGSADGMTLTFAR
jgi:PKD domain-containing protein